MYQKHWKIAIVFLTIAINTIIIMLFLEHKDVLETALSYKEFSVEEKEGKYEISNIEDYLNFAQTVCEGNTYEFCEIILKKDLDFTGVEDVIVIGGLDDTVVEFKGIFNGNGHVIRGLHMENSENTVGMFACLDGIVKNLIMEECSFIGKICGGIAAQMTSDASVLNCYVSAETEGEINGEIVGAFSGHIFNCVSVNNWIVGDVIDGSIENCYYKSEGGYKNVLVGEELLSADDIVVAMNQYLPRVSGFHDVYDLNLWRVTEELYLSNEKADLLESLNAKVHIQNKEIELEGYYSQNDQCWCIAIPAGYQLEDMVMTARTSQGHSEVFKRNGTEEQILYTRGENRYLINYLCADNIDTLYVTLNKNKDLDYVHKNKYEEIPGMLTVFDKEGHVEQKIIKGFYGHGNDSWTFKKKSYNLKMEDRVDLLGIGENEDFALLAGYRMNSLMSFCTTTELVQELDFDYAPEFRLINLFVEGEYAGVYYLAEKIELDDERLELTNLYEETKKMNAERLDTFAFEKWKDTKSLAERYWYNITNNPSDITGAYLLEADSTDYDEMQSRFVSEREIHITLKRFMYASKEEVDYIADYWQEFEDALFSVDGYNQQGKYYTEYIDLESFAMQWLMYELAEEASLGSSIYFYKESEIEGDGLLHACFPWDMEQSYVQERRDVLWNVKTKGRALYGYWGMCYTHEDFRQEVRRIWEEKLVPALEIMLYEDVVETESGLRNLSWYAKEFEIINKLETTRWSEVDPLEKCLAIKEFLFERKEVLNEVLYDEESLPEYFEKFEDLF